LKKLRANQPQIHTQMYTTNKQFLQILEEPMKATKKRAADRPDLSAAVRLWIRKNLLFLIIPIAALLGASGDLGWGMGWAYIGVIIAISVANALVLIPKSPDLIEERSKMQAGTKDWDKWLSISMAIVLPAVVWVVAGFDRRFGWSPNFSLSTQVLSLMVVLLGGLLGTWAMSVNRFFSGTARIQTERGHSVVRGGPYEYVRHPGYAGAILFMLFTPLAIGSWWAFIPVAAYIAVVVARTHLEDEMLQEELTGYKKYAKRIPYRLIPRIW
jgi:protein-S-isoprenylcysteine O-methyltransferase Ste14